jgi:hypothetical protein
MYNDMESDSDLGFFYLICIIGYLALLASIIQKYYPLWASLYWPFIGKFINYHFGL